MAAFARDLAESRLPKDSRTVPELAGGSWSDAFRVLAASLPDEPAVVVIDELPWLAEQDPAFDGALQAAWDRLLSSGRAVEPLVREALEIAALDERIPWPDVAQTIHFVGSVKWLGTPFTSADLGELLAGAGQVPGYRADGTGTVVVSLSGIEPSVDRGRIDLVWGADDLIAVWMA